MKLGLPAGIAAAALLSAIAGSWSSEVASAQAQNIPQVPGDDIFGFTSPTDVGQAGDTGLASENTGRRGKRFGRFFALTSKTELSRTLDANTWGALSLFGSHYRIADGPDLGPNLNRTAFDGLSFEIERRIVERSATNQFAVSLSLEPSWSRLDAAAGTRVDAFAAEAKLFIDAVVVPDRLYWAMNLNYAPGTQRSPQPQAKWIAGAGTNVSAALTYAWSPTLFTGAEIRLLSAFNGALLGHYAGSALLVGPTFLCKLSDQAAFNVAWTPQVAGRSQAMKDRTLDLDNFERQQFRAKLALTF